MLAPITIEDAAHFALPLELALAPDGQTLAITVQHLDLATNERATQVILIDPHQPAAPPRPLTNGKQRDRQPAWSPDGRWIAFVSDRADGNQIWVSATAGGEPRQVTRFRHGAARPVWSPTGETLLCLAEVREGQSPIKLPDEPPPDVKAEAERLRHVTRLIYRWDGNEIFEGRTHLWSIPMVDWIGGDTTLPIPHQLTAGDFDHANPAWSPDGQHIAFISDRAADRDANRTDDLWVLTLADGTLARLTNGDGEILRLAWSPDGRMIAWSGMLYPPDHSIANIHLYVAAIDLHGRWSPPRDLMAHLDITIANNFSSDLGTIELAPPRWTADGRGLLVVANERGTMPLWSFPVTGGAAYRITAGALQIGAYALALDGTAVYAITGQPNRPPEIARFALQRTTPAEEPDAYLSDLNPWLQDRAVALPERFDFFTEDDWWLEGWILWPPAARAPEHAGHRWPVILDIHGGPHGFFGPGFNARQQALAGAGYALVMLNPRGSVGYGVLFAQACDRDWGGADYRDLMAGLETAVRRGRLDVDRLAVMGASYGGYMTNWITSHTPRFKAAVTINSVANLISCFGTGDMDATLGIPEYGGTPWERMGYFLERSPITFAPAVTTPTRVIGAERDWRCPIGQSEEWYTALKLLGRAEVDFLRVPGVSHNINTGSPRQRIAHRQAVFDWIARFVPPGPLP